MFLDETVKKRLLKMSIGYRTDRILYFLLAPHLLGYWTFLKPGYKGKEIGDVLFIFGDVCVLFEAKTRAKAGMAKENWIRAKLKEGTCQIVANCEMLKDGKVVSIRNPWRGEVSWSSLGVKYYHGVIVLMHDTEPYDPRDIEPTLFSSSPIPIHVISLHDISELLRFMNTPWDFVVYWEFRNLLGHKFRLLVHREQSVYSGIISNWVTFAKAQGSKHSDAKLEEDRQFIEAYTKVVLKSGEVNDVVKKKIATSYLLDIAAGSAMSKAEQDKTRKRVGSPEHDFLIKTVEAIADLSRRRRAEYGFLWLDSAEKSKETNCQFHISGCSPSRNRTYVFHARPTQYLDEKSFLEIVMDAMAMNKSSSAIGLSATSENIIHTFKSVLSSIEETEFEEDSYKLLNATSVFIDILKGA